ncbi:hypothetical protein N0V93_006894 [Gnomoniopsis smithogilvyi]|uniref:Rho-GAP domain-containing protein n=1 Tax=Gnomoniopsis smithogilvyi TaxID=1191159 RepID=A0A9W8YRL6_9PEZI|nr:hypothetical protein N0V93_006894 [Gnomoniopsis smithogilvyi]
MHVDVPSPGYDCSCHCAPPFSLMTTNMRPPREVNTPDLQPGPSASSSLAHLSLPAQKTSSGVQSSATWTSTSGDLGGLSDTDDIRERNDFVEEYNRIAKKYGIRQLVPGNPGNLEASGVLQKRGWWSRTFRKTSSQSTENSLRRQRSSSHVMGHLAHPKRDSLKDQDLQGLVRLCGKSFLYLPPEYAPGSLILPTCFRATAQYLVQHAPETRGVFRIPGSIRVVNELYEFYCAEQSADVASTVRSPNLPAHILVGIHDVASCFKKFLSGLPGGILGSLSLFDAMIAINSRLYGDPEFSRTKQSKIRARLIALAIGTLRSQFRRELICAVFGLLCLLGRAAETAPREDELGRPLPTSDLMGYNALGIVFGPLLIGDMLGSYAVKLADPSSGLFIVPRSPSSSKSQKGKKKSKEAIDDPGQPPFLDVDKIHVANNITEMLVTNWRDVVRQMRSLDTTMSVLHSCSHSRSQSSFSNNKPRRSSSCGRTSENEHMVANPRDERVDGRLGSFERDTNDNARPSRRHFEHRHAHIGASGNRLVSFRQIDSTNDALSVKKTRPISARNVSSTRPVSDQIGALPPPLEKSANEEREVHPAMRLTTPLKSSLKSSDSKRFSAMPNRREQTSDKNTSPERNDTITLPPARSPSGIANGISPIKKHFETLEAQHRQRLPSPTILSDARQQDHGQPRSRATPNFRGSHGPHHDQLRQPATPSSTQTSSTTHDRIRQRADPSRIVTYCTEYDQPRPKFKSPLSGMPRTEYEKKRYRKTLTRSGTYGPDHELPPSLSTYKSTETAKARPENAEECVEDDSSHYCTHVSSSMDDPLSTDPRALTQVDGSPERASQQPLCDLDPMKAYQAGPGIKVLKAPSTLRSQPKMSHVDPKIAAAKLRSSVWRTSSHGSADSALLSAKEPVKMSGPASKQEKAGSDQIDGAMDFVSTVPSPRESFTDLRSELERRGIGYSLQTSSLPVLNKEPQPRGVLTKKNRQGRKSSWGSPRKLSRQSNCTSQHHIKPGMNKVLGLAAIFDTAAKASPFNPTPGGTIQKKRRETAGVISPYTSNPSPRTSLQSVTSVSTPISLMSPTRLSIHLSAPDERGRKKCMIPRLQNPSVTYSAGRTEDHMSPISALQRDKSRNSVRSSNGPSKLSTPSRLPVKKKTAITESPPLPQFDGLSGTRPSLLRLTAQQEIRPAGFHSSPIPQISGGYKGIPRLCRFSTSSRNSDDTSLSRESTSLSLTLRRDRIASSLHDQVRSLRIELSEKNEDCAQLRLDLEESRKINKVNEILLREDLDRARSDTQEWRYRAERAERRVEKYERLAVQIKDLRDLRGQRGDTADDYSFMSGSDHLTNSDRGASLPLTTRMNQSIKRTPPVDANGTNSLGVGDGFSECSSSTVVRTIGTSHEDGLVHGSGLWSAVEDLVDFTSP